MRHQNWTGALLVALTGCVPSVDEVVIRCDAGADDSCPTGWHCAANAVCRPGETTPQVRWLDPAPDAAIVGRTTVHFEGHCPRGLASATLRVVSPQGLVATLAADALVTNDGGDRMTFGATWASWMVEDGPYELEAVVVPAAPPLAPGRTTLRASVANGAPALTITAPANGAIVDGAVPVVASFSGTVPIMRIEAEIQPPPNLSSPVVVELSFGDEEHLTGAFSTTLDTSGLANGPATVALRVTDLRGYITTTGIPVLVEHAR